MENSNSSASISSNLTFINSIFDETLSLSDEDSQDYFEDPGRYDSSDNETMDVTQDFENEKNIGHPSDFNLFGKALCTRPFANELGYTVVFSSDLPFCLNIIDLFYRILHPHPTKFDIREFHTIMNS